MISHLVDAFLHDTHYTGHHCKIGNDSNRGTGSSSKWLQPYRPDHIPSSFPPEDGSNPPYCPFLYSIWESRLPPPQKRPYTTLIRPLLPQIHYKTRHEFIQGHQSIFRILLLPGLQEPIFMLRLLQSRGNLVFFGWLCGIVLPFLTRFLCFWHQRRNMVSGI